jgi:DNA-binding SARP family transcriptional activator
VSVNLPAQRLLSFLALQCRPVHRDHVAATLWIDSSDERAAGSLRSALWRLRHSGLDIVDTTGGLLRLDSSVSVDAHRADEWARTLLDPAHVVEQDDIDRVPRLDDLLPGWYDEWVIVERERLRELLVHALESLCRRLAAGARYGEALEAGFAAVKMEPLRESGHRCVIEVHLAEGNKADAFRQYDFYCRMLANELHMAPSGQMTALVEDLAVR